MVTGSRHSTRPRTAGSMRKMDVASTVRSSDPATGRSNVTLISAVGIASPEGVVRVTRNGVTRWASVSAGAVARTTRATSGRNRGRMAFPGRRLSDYTARGPFCAPSFSCGFGGLWMCRSELRFMKGWRQDGRDGQIALRQPPPDGEAGEAKRVDCQDALRGGTDGGASGGLK